MKLDVMRPKYFYEDYVFLVCNRESGVQRLADLRERPKRHRILVGTPGSGTEVTWKAFTLLDPNYRAIPAQGVDDRAALEIATRTRRQGLLGPTRLGTGRETVRGIGTPSSISPRPDMGKGWRDLVIQIACHLPCPDVIRVSG